MKTSSFKGDARRRWLANERLADAGLEADSRWYLLPAGRPLFRSTRLSQHSQQHCQCGGNFMV